MELDKTFIMYLEKKKKTNQQLVFSQSSCWQNQALGKELFTLFQGSTSIIDRSI